MRGGGGRFFGVARRRLPLPPKTRGMHNADATSHTPSTHTHTRTSHLVERARRVAEVHDVPAAGLALCEARELRAEAVVCLVVCVGCCCVVG